MTSSVTLIPIDLVRNQALGTNSGLEKAANPAQRGDAAGLSADELKQLSQLKARDREVRAHEQAHLGNAGGIATGGASFTFATGPDGNRYAIGGEVNIDTSAIPGDPEATLRKAELIRRAALAPAQPSSQDQKVASAATAMANKARLDLLQQRQDTANKGDQTQNPTVDINV